jgi:hypothetical protein
MGTTAVEKPVEEAKTVDQIIEEKLDEKLGGFMDRITKTLEKAYPTEQPSKKTPGLVILGPVSPVNKSDKFMKPFREANPDKEFRLIYSHPTAVEFRRMDNWEPEKDKNGNEVRFGDHTLASMSKNRYQEEIVGKREAKTNRMRIANGKKLEEAAKEIQSDSKGVVDAQFSGTYNVSYDKEGAR